MPCRGIMLEAACKERLYMSKGVPIGCSCVLRVQGHIWKWVGQAPVLLCFQWCDLEELTPAPEPQFPCLKRKINMEDHQDLTSASTFTS